MKVIIIDDEARARRAIRDILIYLGGEIDVVSEGNNVKSGLESILHYKPDLVFLDIDMPDGTGFDLLKQLPDIQFKVIFITAFEEFAIKAFEFSAIDYILKPIDPLKLINAVKRAQGIVEKDHLSTKLNALFSNLSLQNKTTKKLVLNTEQNVHIIETKDIVRCESDGGYTVFYFVNHKRIMVSRNLKFYEKLLGEYDFFRAHQSHLININYIDYYKKNDGGVIVMKTGDEVPVSQRKREQFLTILSRV